MCHSYLTALFSLEKESQETMLPFLMQSSKPRSTKVLSVS